MVIFPYIAFIPVFSPCSEQSSEYDCLNRVCRDCVGRKLLICLHGIGQNHWRALQTMIAVKPRRHGRMTHCCLMRRSRQSYSFIRDITQHKYCMDQLSDPRDSQWLNFLLFVIVWTDHKRHIGYRTGICFCDWWANQSVTADRPNVIWQVVKLLRVKEEH